MVVAHRLGGLVYSLWRVLIDHVSGTVVAASPEAVTLLSCIRMDAIWPAKICVSVMTAWARFRLAVLMGSRRILPGCPRVEVRGLTTLPK